MAEISPERLRSFRAHAQFLSRRDGDVRSIVRSLCGVNAQSGPAMMLALRARIPGFAEGMAWQDDLMRTWAMRGTLHLLAREDAWVVALLGPAMLKKDRRRRLELGLDDEKTEEAMRSIPAIMKDGDPMTRGELVDALAHTGVDVGRSGQAPYHLVYYAGLSGLICLGPDHPGGEQTYVLADKANPMARDKALKELAYRYITGYGPASQKDFVTWSGLSAADAKKGFELAGMEYELTGFTLEGRSLWSAAEEELPPADTVVNLLPAFDTYILGYADRGDVVPPEHQKDVYHGGQTVPVVMVDGLAAGVWRYERKAKTIAIKVRMFERTGAGINGRIEEEAEDIGRLFGLSPEVTYVR